MWKIFVTSIIIIFLEGTGIDDLFIYRMNIPVTNIVILQLLQKKTNEYSKPTIISVIKKLKYNNLIN